MPKLKIRKSVARRFRVTKKGKVLHRTAFGGHLKVNKSKSQIRKYKKMKPIKTAVARKIKRLLGVSTK
jgi:large subunit ribosomal protein L35